MVLNQERGGRPVSRGRGDQRGDGWDYGSEMLASQSGMRSFQAVGRGTGSTWMKSSLWSGLWQKNFTETRQITAPHPFEIHFTSQTQWKDYSVNCLPPSLFLSFLIWTSTSPLSPFKDTKYTFHSLTQVLLYSSLPPLPAYRETLFSRITRVCCVEHSWDSHACEAENDNRTAGTTFPCPGRQAMSYSKAYRPLPVPSQHRPCCSNSFALWSRVKPRVMTASPSRLWWPLPHVLTLGHQTLLVKLCAPSSAFD